MIMTSGTRDASRIAAEKGINLKDISLNDARKLMSEEHKALGYRPPHGSLASAAQAAASKHPDTASHRIDDEILRKAALDDAARIAAQRTQSADATATPNVGGNGNSGVGINLDAIGLEEARRLMSAEHKALGYRPPPGSLAADAQAAAARHPNGTEGVPKPPKEILTKEALKDAARIATERQSSGSSLGGSPPRSPEHTDHTTLTPDVSAHGSEPISTKEVASITISEASDDRRNGVDLTGSNAESGEAESPTMSAVAKAIMKEHPEESKVTSEHEEIGYRPDASAQIAAEEVERVVAI